MCDGIASGHPSRTDLLAAGCRVAAALQFGTDALADDPGEAALTVSMLARGTELDDAAQQVPCTEHLMRKLTEAALMTPLSARRWGFVHHSFQEYLAAAYLQIHRTSAQVRGATLMAGDGSSRHVVDSQREVAAWLAVTDDSLFEEILACDPQVLLRHLTRETAGQLSALADRYPDHWQLRELTRQHSRDLAAQLSDVVTESLRRLQDLLSAPNGWAVLLWHWLDFNASSGWWPAWEEDLSDLIATFLQHDLAGRQVIVNREVQILRPGLNGHRTDIHVQANPPSPGPELQPLTVIIECKRCWNKELPTGLSTQLVDKYLTMPGRNAGIYLVGYFDSPRWNHGKSPRREHSPHEFRELRAEQARIAAEEAGQKSVSVTAFILDCRLPSGGPAT